MTTQTDRNFLEALRRPNRRQALIGLGAGIGALTLSGRIASAQEQPRRGGVLNVMLEADNRSLDPLFGSSGVDRRTFNLFAESLLLQPVPGTFEPWLAESYEVQDGGKAVIFHIRKGVTFHDGEPLDGAAAKFNLDRFVDPNLKPYPKQYVREIQSTDLLDEYTIRVNLSAPSVLFLPMICAEAGSIMSPKAIREKGEDFLRFPVGTGPFIVTGRSTGEIVAEKNPNYWKNGADGKPLPYLDGVKITVNGNSAVRLVQAQSGAAQLIDPVSAKDFATVEANPNLRILGSNVGGAYLVAINLDRYADNPDLRKAICLGLDRQAMMQVISQGRGQVLTGIEPPHSWAYDPTLKGHEYDPVEAKAAYERSGHKGPITLTISQRDDDIQLAEIMQQMMRAIGMDMQIEVLERLANAQKVIGKRDFDVAIARAPLQGPDIHTFYVFSYSRVASTNYPGIKDEAIYDLVDRALVEFDRDKRRQLYVEIQKRVLDTYAETFLFWNPRKDVASAKLHGERFDATNNWLFHDMWLES